MQRWDVAYDDLHHLKEAIESNLFRSSLNLLHQRTWLIHWSLFVYFNRPKGRDEYLLEHAAPHLLRYLTAAVIVHPLPITIRSLNSSNVFKCISMMTPRRRSSAIVSRFEKRFPPRWLSRRLPRECSSSSCFLSDQHSPHPFRRSLTQVYRCFLFYEHLFFLYLIHDEEAERLLSEFLR